MSQQSRNNTYALIELLLGFQAASTAATSLLKQVHDEGRVVSMDELKQIRTERQALMADLDEAIARAEAETPAPPGGSP